MLQLKPDVFRLVMDGIMLAGGGSSMLWTATAIALLPHSPLALPPMAKYTLSFVCQNCGAAYNRWQGKCEVLRRVEYAGRGGHHRRHAMPVSIRSKRKGRQFALESLTGKSQEAPRLPSGMAELDRVTGGGFVRGSVLLVGGDPGIGKSTLLTQATSLLARAGIARSISPAKRRWRRCGCAPSGWALPTRRCSLPPKHRSRTSSRRCRKARCRA